MEVVRVAQKVINPGMGSYTTGNGRYHKHADRPMSKKPNTDAQSGAQAGKNGQTVHKKK